MIAACTRVALAVAVRVVLAITALMMRRKVLEMAATLPVVTAAELARVAAAGAESDMVLLNADGTLTTDSTDDDIATYQVAGQWPRYVCRVGAITSSLRRHPDGEAAAAALNAQLARQFALDELRGPHHTGVPAQVVATPAPPDNAPVRIGDSAVTIRGT